MTKFKSYDGTEWGTRLDRDIHDEIVARKKTEGGVKKMKVYVVEKGFYSDRHIVYIASTMEGAKQYVELMNKYKKFDEDEYDIDCYKVDAPVMSDKARSYHVVIKDDKITVVDEVPFRKPSDDDDYDWSWSIRDDATDEWQYNFPTRYELGLDNGGEFFVIASSKDEAFKIASDKLAVAKYRRDVG